MTTVIASIASVTRPRERGNHLVKTHLIVTVIANDRPGIVRALSDAVRGHGGNWMESSMTRLGGKFAGIVRVSVGKTERSALVAALEALLPSGIRVSVEEVDQQEDAVLQTVSIQLVANERPGIIEEISALLAERDINVEELSSRVDSAPMSADELFHATILAGLPPTMSREMLQGILEGLSDDLTVEINTPES